GNDEWSPATTTASWVPSLALAGAVFAVYRLPGRPALLTMIYVDVSAAVHSKAGLGRYSERLAHALAAQHPGEIALFYNQGKGAHLPPRLLPLPRRSVQAGYKPWRMSVLLAHLSHVRFDSLVPDATLFHSTEHLLFP